MSRAPGNADSELVPVELSRTGTVWSFTNAGYQPPEPYVPGDRSVRAVRDRRGRAGQGADRGAGPVRRGRDGRRPRRRHGDGAGARHPLHVERGPTTATSVDTSCGSGSRSVGGALSISVERAGRWRRPVAVLVSGMHPWGKWGRNFVEYGVAAIRALARGRRRRLHATSVRRRRRHDAQRLSRVRRRCATFAQAHGMDGRAGHVDLRRRARRGRWPSRRHASASSPACATWPSWSAPTPPRRASSPPKGERQTDPDGCGSGCSAPPTRPTSRCTPGRRIELFGATQDDFAAVKVKNARHGFDNPYARYRKEFTAEEVMASPDVADPLRLLHICATSDGGAAAGPHVDGVGQGARPHQPGAHQGRVDGDADVPQHDHRDAELRLRLRRGPRRPERTRSRSRSPTPLRAGRHRAPRTCRWPRSTTCRPSSSTGTRTSGSARRARPRSCSATAMTTLGGRHPGEPVGGACLLRRGGAGAAIAQVCEVTWQLRGQAAGRQVEGATAGITANQGLFGHGSSVILTR